MLTQKWPKVPLRGVPLRGRILLSGAAASRAGAAAVDSADRRTIAGGGGDGRAGGRGPASHDHAHCRGARRCEKKT